MKFQVGDTVMHWNYGLGQITGMEERLVTGTSQLYYVLRIKDLSVWVPADKSAGERMRPPTSARSFKKLLAVLGGSADDLSDDRRERKLQLHAKMSAGTAESICHVLRDLTTRELNRPLNDDDRATLERARAMLLGEWVYALQVPPDQAEHDLHKILKPTATQARTSSAAARA